jgi:hypothetical protein
LQSAALALRVVPVRAVIDAARLHICTTCGVSQSLWTRQTIFMNTHSLFYFTQCEAIVAYRSRAFLIYINCNTS